MPRLRCLLNPDEHDTATLSGPAARARRAHLLTHDRRLEVEEQRTVPQPLPRHLLIQEYADDGRGCGQVLVYGACPVALLQGARDEIRAGWVPVEVHDLDTGQSWGVDLVPAFLGSTRPPAAVAAAHDDLTGVASACGYSPDEECSIDALIDYKDAIEDRLHGALAAGRLA